MKYRVVFEFADKGYSTSLFPLAGLFFIGIGVVLVLIRKNLPGWWGKHPRASNVFAFFWLGFSIIWTSLAFFGTYSQYKYLKSAIQSGRVQVAEGKVTDFVPMPYGGHSSERFCVQGKCFSYSDYHVSSGFNNTRSHGGPIQGGLQVRVGYVEETIVRLEISE